MKGELRKSKRKRSLNSAQESTIKRDAIEADIGVYSTEKVRSAVGRNVHASRAIVPSNRKCERAGWSMILG